MKYSNSEIELFNEAGVNVENKDYSKEEVERLKMKVTDYIMSQSLKDTNKYREKFKSIL